MGRSEKAETVECRNEDLCLLRKKRSPFSGIFLPVSYFETEHKFATAAVEQWLESCLVQTHGEGLQQELRSDVDGKKRSSAQRVGGP